MQTLTRPIPADQIQHNLFSANLKVSVSQQMKWNSSMSTFQYELVPLPDSVKKCYGCSLGGAKGSMIVTGIIPKTLLSVIEIDQLWEKTYLVILRTVLISNLRITT